MVYVRDNRTLSSLSLHPVEVFRGTLRLLNILLSYTQRLLAINAKVSTVIV